MLGITKNNKHSYNDFGVTIKSKTIGNPSKNKVTAYVPYMNGTYDFSNLYGGVSYSERDLEYTFNIPGKDKVRMNILKTKIIDWLFDGNEKMKIYDDSFPNYYFLAEAIDCDFKEEGRFGELKISFIAYPFMISDLKEGHDIWNKFSFETDIAQNNKYNVNGSLDIILYNNGSNGVNPSVRCSSEMKIIDGNTTYLFDEGTTKSDIFILRKGTNKLKIIGEGEIEFIFYKEVL